MGGINYSSHPVIVSYEDISNGINDDLLNSAFGPDSLGIIIVKDLPSKFKELRAKVLTAVSVLSHLPELELRKLESEESMWLSGWSCGKEILASSGRPDESKGSFYVNCAFHKDPQLEGPSQELYNKFLDFKTYTTPNIWPSSSHTGLENFESDCKNLCNFIIDVAEVVASNCDKYISKRFAEYENGFLERIVKNSTCTKARLLHYFPLNEKSNNEDDWCGKHVDHSCITGLVSALYLNESEGLTAALESSPDPMAGLYIYNRHGETVQVHIPSDCLAFQSGSALEAVSKGKFKAVPHYVKGSSMPNIARNTLAVFCQPDLDEQITDEENFAQFAERVVKGNH